MIRQGFSVSQHRKPWRIMKPAQQDHGRCPVAGHRKSSVIMTEIRLGRIRRRAADPGEGAAEGLGDGAASPLHPGGRDLRVLAVLLGYLGGAAAVAVLPHGGGHGPADLAGVRVLGALQRGHEQGLAAHRADTWLMPLRPHHGLPAV